MPIARLNRSVLHLSGEGLIPWLEGIITQNLTSELTFTALLTPQGKIIADFFVTRLGNDVFIDTPPKFSGDLLKRLRMYKLRAPIDIKEVSETYHVYALWDGEGEQGQRDPRHPSLGYRWLTTDVIEAGADYNAHRLSLGVVESEWDFETGTSFPADANMDLMNGVDFKKGCFVGQEVVSRMKRMTTVKKRMRGVVLSGPAQAGDRIMGGERVIGEILSVHGSMAMALIRLDRWRDSTHAPMINGAEIEIMDSVDGQGH